MTLLLLFSRTLVPPWLIISGSSTTTTSAGSGRLENTKWSETVWDTNSPACFLSANHGDEKDTTISYVCFVWVGSRIPGQNPLLRPERKSPHCFGNQQGCSWRKSFSKRAYYYSLMQTTSIQWRISYLFLLSVFLRLLWLLAETIMTSVAQTARSERLPMCMMDQLFVQVLYLQVITAILI